MQPSDHKCHHCDKQAVVVLVYDELDAAKTQVAHPLCTHHYLETLDRLDAAGHGARRAAMIGRH